MHRNGHTYPHGSGAFGKRSAPNPELFESAPESGSFENGGFVSGSFLCLNIVSESYLQLFPRRSTKKKKKKKKKKACPSDNIASRACAVSLPKPVAAHFFLFRRELPSKTKRRMDSGHMKCGYFQRQLYLAVFPDEGRRVFLLSFHFPLDFFFFFITCLHIKVHKLPSLIFGAQAREAIQKNGTGK